MMRLVGDALLFLLIGIGLRWLVLELRAKMKMTKRRWPWAAGIFLLLVFLVGLWLIPALFPPNWAYKGDLPAKPALIAHRGASMLAPENTLAAAELAVVNQAFGFETDVRITLDGVPILMHDETLARTTNIAEVYPDRVEDRVSNFSLDELRQLNAGLWFIQTDPFRTIASGDVSQTQLGINQGQSIPTLAETLVLMERKGMVIIFDMRYPPSNHPYYADFFDIVLDICKEAGLNGDIWFLVDRDHLRTVQENTPQFTLVIGSESSDLPTPEKLLDLGYEIVNVDSGIMTRSIEGYRAKGLGVNIYTIDQPWLFSQFWLSGVTSITTNNVHTLSKLDQPFLNVPYSRYILFWGLFGIIISIWLAASQPTPKKEELGPPIQTDVLEGDQEMIRDLDVLKPQMLEEAGPDIFQDEDSETL
jgi:glycerophosphoryl diester phosphodiesterase